MNATLIIIGAIYLAVMYAVGVWSSRRMHGTGDYLLAGRKLGPYVTAMSQQASMLSGYTYTAVPGITYGAGWPGFWWGVGEPLASVLNFSMLGRRIRRWSEIIDAQTIPEFLAKRFQQPLLRWVGGVLTILFVGAYLVAQFQAMGTVLKEAADISYEISVVIGGVIVLGYVLLGGYLAVCYTDFLQSILMWVMSMLLVWMGLEAVGGFTALNNTLHDINPEYVGLLSAHFPVVIVLTILLWDFFGFPGNPHIAIRLYSMESPETARKAGVIAGLFQGTFFIALFAIGLISLAYFGEEKFAADPEVSGIALWVELFPGPLAALMTCGAAAAVMSTSDSFLMVLVGVIVRDILKPMFPDMEDDKLLKYGRFATIGVFLVALAVSLKPFGLIFTLVVFAYGALGIAFGVPHLFAVFWKKTTWQGVLASQVITIPVLSFLTLKEINFLGLHPFLFSCGLSIVILVVVSLLTPRKEKVDGIDQLFDLVSSYASMNLIKQENTELINEARAIMSHLKASS